MKNCIALSLMLLAAPCFADATLANLYTCSGVGAQVSYSTSSIAGEPLVSFKLGKKTYSGRGDEIQVQQTVLGTLVTIIKSSASDLYTDTLTLLAPDVNVSDLGVTKIFTTRLFETRIHTTIGGPQLVDGLIQSNQSRLLNCTATAVLF